MSIHALFLIISFFFGFVCVGFSYFLFRKELQFTKEYRDYTIPALLLVAGFFNIIPPVTVVFFFWVFSA